MPLLLIFVLVPIIEIALFIQVGGWIGLWPTLAIVVLTAVIGTWMLREQGLAELARLRNSLENMRDPSASLAHGAMILFAGALLLTPGFFTDTVGFLLLIPTCRRAAIAYFRSRITTAQFNVGPEAHQPPPSSGETIEGDFTDVSPQGDKASSGWTKH